MELSQRELSQNNVKNNSPRNDILYKASEQPERKHEMLLYTDTWQDKEWSGTNLAQPDASKGLNYP